MTTELSTDVRIRTIRKLEYAAARIHMHEDLVFKSTYILYAPLCEDSIPVDPSLVHQGCNM